MNLPQTHRRQSSGETRAQARRRLNEALQGLPDLRAALSTPDPYSPGFGRELELALDTATASYWPTIRGVFPELSEQEALRHAWAAATRAALQVATLYRSVQLGGSAELRDLAQKLIKVTAGEIASDPVAKVMVSGGCDLPPDFSSASVLMPGMRVRYALANRLSAGAKVHEFVRAALEVPGASLYLKRRELLRMLKVAVTQSVTIEPYEATQFLMREKDEHQLVLSSPELIKALLPPALSKRVRLNSWVSERRAHRDATAQMSARLFKALEIRDFDQAEQLLRNVRLDPLARAALRNAATSYGQPLGGTGQAKAPKKGEAAAAATAATEAATPDGAAQPGTVDAPRQWQPMSQACQALVKSAFPRRHFPSHWLLDGSQIAGALRTKALPCSSLSDIDRLLLEHAWSQADKAALVMAGVHEIFSVKSAVWTGLPVEVVWGLIGQRKDISALMEKRLRAGVDGQELLELLSRQSDPRLLQEIERSTGSRKAKSGFAASVIHHAGTEVWRAAGGWSLHGKEASLHLLWLTESRAAVIDPKAFTQEVADYLLKLAEERPEKRTEEGSEKRSSKGFDRRYASARAAKGGTPTPSTIEAAAALCNRNYAVLQQLVDRAPKQWLGQLIPRLTRLSQLKYLQRKAPAEFRSQVLRARALRTQDPKRLLLLLEDGARAGLEIPWSPSWTSFLDNYAKGDEQQTGSSADQAWLQVLVLALRRNVKQLKALAGHVPDAVMRQALREAALRLRGTPGKDPVMLELGAHVGLSDLPHLAAAMVAVEHDAEPGWRVDHCYHQWQLPKNSGGTRTISAPAPSLKRAQRALLDSLLTPLGAHPCAYGFVKGRSIKDNASIHVGREIVVNADVGNCFPSVRWPLVLGALRRDFAGELTAGAIGTILDLCTAEGGLPIGAPTSPALLNRVLLKTDEILEESAQKRGCLYSRYADDITFSGDHGAVKLLGVAKGVLGRIGLNLDPRKTNIFRRGRRQVCTGLVVNEQVSVPRRVRRRLRAAVHRESIEGKSTWHGQPQSTNSLKGRLAFLGMLHPEEAAKLRAKLPSPDPTSTAKGKSKAEPKSIPKLKRIGKGKPDPKLGGGTP